MSRIKEFIFQIADNLGIQPDEVTNQHLQDAVELLYEKHEAVEVCRKCSDSCLECSDLDIDQKMIQHHLETNSKLG